MWVLFSLLSSFFLAGYDLLKKGSLRNNAFIPVLFLSSISGAVLFLLVVIGSRCGFLSSSSIIHIPEASFHEHLMFFLKSVIVGSSWFLAYMAISKLPVTIVIPIGATGPLWTLIGALLIFHERFTLQQWIGITIVLTFFYLFSVAGRKEGISFHNNRWVYAMIGSTIIGAISSLYDKYLLLHYNRMAVQAWFSIYMVLFILPALLFLWYPRRNKTTPFQWRWTIPAIAVVLSVADFFYFYALSDPESQIGIVSIIRRTSAVLGFTFGAIIFKEENIRRKGLALVGILIGILILILNPTLIKEFLHRIF